jgi:hypothetical protein
MDFASLNHPTSPVSTIVDYQDAETTGGDPSQQVARLEARIEELAELLDRCRKVRLASKVAIAIGGALLVAIILGLIKFDPVALIASIAMVLGGIVLFGSNSSTSEQACAALKKAEAERADLIGQLELQVVTPPPYPPPQAGGAAH